MYQRTRSFVLHWLKVPPEPHPPAGAPDSLRIFRAGKNYLTLRLVGWAIPQVIALVGIIFWTVVFLEVETSARASRLPQPNPSTTVQTNPVETVTPTTTQPAPSSKKPKHKPARISNWDDFKQSLVDLARRLPEWGFPLLWLLKIGGLLLYVAQIPLTYAVRRLDYEMRWYVVTDRSLRIRTGIWKMQELTMSFANLQQVVISQNPLQRVLGLSDVRVQSAGGGQSGEHAKSGGDDSLHTAVFHCVENAPEIRDLILARLQAFRASGLGDPDELPLAATNSESKPSATAIPADTLAAAHELLHEARALRRSVTS